MTILTHSKRKSEKEDEIQKSRPLLKLKFIKIDKILLRYLYFPRKSYN